MSAMESLGATPWDVLLVGTGLPQSLLALALSRTGKKVLHVDKNDYYGGAEAALSLQEAKAWVETANSPSYLSPFRDARIARVEASSDSSSPNEPRTKLGFSRAYSLSLSPQLIYTRSRLLPTLVTSKVYRQLEFLAVGSWWIYTPGSSVTDVASGYGIGGLRKIPGRREDVFADSSIDLRSKRSLMKFLKVTADFEDHDRILQDWGNKPFPEFLSSEYGIAPALQSALLALTLTPDVPVQTTTRYALPRIHRHLTSIGVFGPGFGSVIPKWGGTSEITQVACRACAVGGGVYVLKTGIEQILQPSHALAGTETGNDDAVDLLTVTLGREESIQARRIVGSNYDLPLSHQEKEPGSHEQLTRTISIINSPLLGLFPNVADGVPPPAVSVVAFPTGSIDYTPPLHAETPPVYLFIHSSETGECPTNQCVVYGSVKAQVEQGSVLLDLAIRYLLAQLSQDAKPEVLWSLRYTQDASSFDHRNQEIITQSPDESAGVLRLSNPSTDLAFDDRILDDVKGAWDLITDQAGDFMQFEDRELGASDDELS